MPAVSKPRRIPVGGALLGRRCICLKAKALLIAGLAVLCGLGFAPNAWADEPSDLDLSLIHISEPTRPY